MALITSVSAVLRVLGVVLVLATGVGAAWVLLTSGHDVASPVAPCVTVGIACLVIGECVMHPFSKAAVSAFHCYVADKEMSLHDGFTAPRHTPLPLHRFVNEHCSHCHEDE